MKRTLLLALALALVVTAASADEVYILSNTPTAGGGNVIPFGGKWPSSSNPAGDWTYQTFIPAKFLGGKGFLITGLALAPTKTDTHTANFGVISISHNKLAAPSGTFKTNLPNPTVLFTQGPWKWAATANTWSPLPLDKGASFVYNGTDNLCIEWRFKGSTSQTLSLHNDGTTAGNPSRIYKYGVGAAKATSGTVGAGYYQKIRLTVSRVNLTGAGTPNPGGKVTLNLSAPGDAGNVYQVASSLGTGPIVIDTRQLNLTLDALMIACVEGKLPTVFQNYGGKLDTNGAATATVAIPNIPAFIGVRLHSAFVTIKTGAPSNINSISPTYTFTVVK